MKLWSFQPASIVDAWLNNDIWYAQLEKSPYIKEEQDEPTKNFTNAYHWLNNYLVNYYYDHGINIGEFETPIWAWRMVNNKVKKPDLRLRQFASYKSNVKLVHIDHNGDKHIEYYSEPFCLVHLEVPDELVVLSNFEKWHTILNKNYLYSYQEFRAQCDCHYEESEWEYHWCDNIDNWYTTIMDLSEEDIMNSWENIFLAENTCDDMQATFPYVRKDWLTQVDRIIMNKK